MNMPDLRTLIEEYLKNARLMQVATTVKDKPWVCSVWFGYDSELNIYWFSSPERRHSREVMQNQQVAAAIALPQTPQDPPRGLQLEGTVELVTDEHDVNKALSVYAERIFSHEQIAQFRKSETHPHRFYKITPKLFVLFDAVNFPDNSRQEYIP